jgi:predicted ATPase
MARLRSLRLSGFKSIGKADVSFSPLNVLIGANGAGKSNLLGFFRLIGFAMAGRLRTYVGLEGGASRLLRFGPEITPQFSATIEIEGEGGLNYYRVRLAHAAGDVLVFLEESVEFRRHGGGEPRFASFGPGHFESLLGRPPEDNNPTARFVKWHLDRWKHFHFHDTSDKAPLKQTCEVRDNRYLRSNASNLAAFLYALREQHRANYEEIRDTIRRVAPFFDDFALEPERLDPETIRLEWKERDGSGTFDASYLSDGTLRFICLATLLLQPELPLLIVIDEPELGLHPSAIALLASLMRSASNRSQIVVATQSVALVDEFSAEDVVVVDRAAGGSEFRRPSAEELDRWLDEYSLGDVSQRNAIGGRPAASP